MDRFLKRMKGKEAVGPVPTPVLPSAEEALKRFFGQELSRRLRRPKKSSDNELYRSNSFKFERFDRSDSQLDLSQQVSLCDDYSLPVDFVNKKRPLSVGSSLFWDKASPHSENIEVLDVYCDPRDSKAYLQPGEEVKDKLYTTPDKEYSHPYSTDCSPEVVSGEEKEVYEDVGEEEEESLVRATPYYYADLNSDTSEDRMSPRLDEMSRRHQYETAFDSKISKSEDELDVDDVTNKSIMVADDKSHEEPYYKRPRSLVRMDDLAKGLSQMDLGLRPFVAPSPPSSAPLPAKFHSGIGISSVQSAPDIPIRAKDLRLPIKSSKHRGESRPRSLIVKGDPHSSKSEVKSFPKTRGMDILEIKGRPTRRGKYSSTESMATSSSGGSLESIRSSTSEGNRSTSSCESRRSSSLSSHSSDSGSGPGFHASLNTLNTRFNQKLHILSPISDKSSQEPCSETSENNKNNNSEKASPEEVVISPQSETQKKRRAPQNRNLINLGLSFDQETHQGSDSGISIESRVGNINPLDFSDLPFDMPKLRRRRILQEPQVQDTSSSATSVDLRELPFDMPKLRRRLRPIPTATQPTSSNSQETKTGGLKRPSLSLDLSEGERRRPSLGLDFPPRPIEIIDLPDPIDTEKPLEQQGWYHGAITRLEAENILRNNKEGSFLVRNSESMKQDYSLSLKSARGFMHMRIQQCQETGRYILGQFSNPFSSIPEMIKHYSVNRLPIRGAEHMCLSHPIIEQLL